jgi:mRNA interferase HigB
MRLIAISTVRDFWVLHPDSEQPLKAWVDEVRSAEWYSPAHIKRLYRSASILKGGRVVFNIAGNKYRLAVQVAYHAQIVFIKFLGTHSEYDNIDAQTIRFNKGGN